MSDTETAKGKSLSFDFFSDWGTDGVAASASDEVFTWLAMSGCLLWSLILYFAAGGVYSSDIFMDCRTSAIVASATLRACAEPASRISHASRGLSSYFLRRSCMGFKMLTSASAAQPLHSMHPIPADALVSILNPMQERRKKYED